VYALLNFLDNLKIKQDNYIRNLRTIKREVIEMGLKNSKDLPVGHINEKGEFEGTRLVGKESKDHIHSDGEKGTDIYVQREVVKDGRVVHKEVAKDWGKVHTHDDEE